MNDQCFFVLSTARSGSTSLARILNTATNGCCEIEPMPNLNVESRWAMDGKTGDLEATLTSTIMPRVRKGMAKYDVYGEKNVTYGPFVIELHTLLDCKFIFLTRDGRDVVRSLMDWHNRMFGTIYRECADPGDLSPRALAAAANLPVHLDTSDYARPRPGPDHPLHDRWEWLSRFEMCAYYWATINDQYLDKLAQLPKESWLQLDYTHPEVDHIIRACDFCSLTGVERTRVEEMLEGRINSLKDRTGEPLSYVPWTGWDGGQRRRFEAIAGQTMRRLGYFDDAATRWRPANYGQCWRDRQADTNWFEWMHDSRRSMHEEAVKWIHARDLAGEPIDSVADFGCGIGVGYCDALADRRYVGVDLIPANVEWCRTNRPNPRHEYHQFDFVVEPTPERYDLVMSSGTIDNAWDVEAYLDAMIRASKRWIYITCYRGWFPELDEHRYSWSAEHACFYNDVSSRRVHLHLESRGCREITIEPVQTKRRDISMETLIVARVDR